MRRVGTVVLTTMMAVAIAGCTSDPDAPSPSPVAIDPAFAAAADLALADAQAGGASDAQVEVLEAAAQRGELPMSEARVAQGNMFDCFAESGVSYTDLGPSSDSPYADLEYEYSIATGSAAADLCYGQEFQFVDHLYQLQPAAVAYGDKRIVEAQAELRACVLDHGLELEPDATLDELKFAVWNLREGHAIDGVGVEIPKPDRFDCLAESGLTEDDLELVNIP